MPKHSLTKTMLDQEIQKIVEAGFIDKWLQDMNYVAEKRSRKVSLHDDFIQIFINAMYFRSFPLLQWMILK